MKRTIHRCAFAALFAAGLGVSARADTLNFTGGGALGGPDTPPPVTSGTINGGYFEVGSVHPAGTGVFNPFLTIQQNGNEQGYNTLGELQFDEKRQPEWTHELLLSSLKVVTSPNGTQSYEFTLDLNENDSLKGRLISLDELQIYRANADNYSHLNTSTMTFSDGPSNLVYDLDASGDSSVLLNYDVISRGSGSSDLNVYIPTALFTGSRPYVYLYSKFGTFGDPAEFDFTTDAGFEEWRAVTGANPPVVPVPTAVYGGLMLLGGLAFGKLRARRLTVAS